MIDLNDPVFQFLKQWASLQPNRCNPSPAGEEFYIHDVEIDEGYWVAAHCTLIDLAMLQASLQMAIAAKDARCRLENSSTAWHVTIGRPEPKSSNFQILVFGKNKNPAIAMLEAWVNFLQAEAKFQSTQKAPSSIA